ncbi:MAG TPA: tetratricopeptide repeat protein [Quisquiliibacterium sp.]|nr:tetratricopeptide repeat protein [Quisquiliibacterium sp.]
MKHALPMALNGRFAAQQAAHGRRFAAAEAFWRKGLAQADALDWAAAEHSFARAVELAPRDVLFWINLANAQRKRGEFRTATESARRAFELDRANLLACKLYATCLSQQHRYEDALAVYAALDPATPRDHEYHVEYGEALYQLNRYLDAVPQFIAAFTCKPDYLPAHARLANTLARMGMHEEAAECYRTVAVLAPDDAQALGNIVHQTQYACRWDRLAEDEQRLHDVIERGVSWQTPPFAYLAMDSTARQQLLCATTSARWEFQGIAPLPGAHHAPRAEGERVRVGYLSSDFHHHATAMLMVDVLEQHDRARFDVHLYSYSLQDNSALRQRVIDASEHFIEVGELSNRDVAERIRADGIDILVDLKGFTRGTRMHILGHRPAPIQVEYLGYPGTTGTPFIDYVIGDPVVTPLSMADCYSEKIAQLPNTYQPNDRRRPLPDATPRAALGLPDEALVLCCFNANYKISPQVFERWCAILRAVPDSVLWLYEANVQASRNLLREAQAHGVDAARLVFAPFVAQQRHIARLRNADLFLDTLPYNAHTTASDALWAGVPLVTCAGGTFASRVAASLLRAADMGELVTTSLDDYQALAIALASDRPRLAALRARLEAGRMTVPLFDSTAFARDLEALFARMVERRRLGLAPDHLPA